jgi:UDP-N-acetylmuramyl pentapeptide synthase
MLELGINAPFWHRQLGRFLRKVPSLSQVIFVGDKVQWAQKMVPFGLKFCVVPTWHEALAELKPQVFSDKLMILVKGSHGVGLQNLVHALTDQS